MSQPIAKGKAIRSKPQSVRDQALAAIRRMPVDSSLEDVQYRLYVLEKIRKSEDSYAKDGGLSHAEAKRRMRKWLGK